ncbi:hypothetical protein D3C87_1843680 [compost metagenome]
MRVAQWAMSRPVVATLKRRTAKATGGISAMASLVAMKEPPQTKTAMSMAMAGMLLA